ncbi:hypothetical protein AGMMS49928_19990 [Spirochaetia bacterium]|nr:hypothetical protein AGMMS49928_19990 [Spirochaetia bacterium]
MNCSVRLALLLLLPAAFPVFAQTEPGAAPEPVSVGVLRFYGDEEPVNISFWKAVIEDVENLPFFSADIIPLAAADSAGLPADEPPPREFAHGNRYILTGALYPGRYARHLHLWLWDLNVPRLVYSDGMACQELEDGREYITLMVKWILSRIVQDETPPEKDSKPPPKLTDTIGAVEPVEPDPEKWLWLGLRVGSSLRFYDRPDRLSFKENSISSYFLNLNTALQASVHLLPWLAVQAEVDFTTDNAPFTPDTASATKTNPFYSRSLMFPLLVRLNIHKGSMIAGLLAGPYFFLPLGRMRNDALGGSFDYKMDLPIGYTAGFNIGVKLGLGYLFLDIRWAEDLGTLQRVSDGVGLYKRSGVTFSIGFEMSFFDK